jgi:hypothetical protein
VAAWRVTGLDSDGDDDGDVRGQVRLVAQVHKRAWPLLLRLRLRR